MLIKRWQKELDVFFWSDKLIIEELIYFPFI